MDQAAFQVIVLGPTGGPREDCVTGLLVRSTSTEWSKGSVVAVDAGTLLAGIIRTLEPYAATGISINKDGKRWMTEGPFVGLELPNVTAQANAAYIFREIIGAVLITHPHLDHLAGLAINTPFVEAGNGPKTVAALPSVIAAIKNHMFNDIIWPNLSDEDGGAGLVTYQRLVEGGNPRFGQGGARGYVRACEGLVTKCISVSHGRCRQQYHPETGRHHRVGSAVFTADPMMLPSRTISVDHGEGSVYSPARSSSRISSAARSNTKEHASNYATVESSAFFIRDSLTGSEIVIFGDIEPDTISLEPRNKHVWEIAAPKVASGCLRAIFIECSFNDGTDDNSLYGHLCPRHLIAELTVLATKVMEEQHQLTLQQQQQQLQQLAQESQTQHHRGRSSTRKRRRSEYDEEKERGDPKNPDTNTNNGRGIDNNSKRNSNVSFDVSPGRLPPGTETGTRGREKGKESTYRESSRNDNSSRRNNKPTTQNDDGDDDPTRGEPGESLDRIHDGDCIPSIADPVGVSDDVNIGSNNDDGDDDDEVDGDDDSDDDGNGENVNNNAECSTSHPSLHPHPPPPPRRHGHHIMHGVRRANSRKQLQQQPLAGLSIYVIHIKDELTDGPPPGDRILQELRTQGVEAGLGCEFFITQQGQGIWI